MKCKLGEKTKVDEAFELFVRNHKLNARIDVFHNLGEVAPEKLILEAEDTAEACRKIDKELTHEEGLELYYRVENFLQEKYGDPLPD